MPPQSFSVGPQNTVTPVTLHAGIGLIHNSARTRNGRLIRSHVGRGDEGVPQMLEVNGISDDQPHVTINSRARVPTRSRLPRIVGAHGQNVCLALRRSSDDGRSGHIESWNSHTVAGRGEMAVDPDIAVGHHAVEVDEDGLPRGIGGQGEIACDTSPRPRETRPARASRRAFSSNCSLMLQSCGTSSFCHFTSSKPGCSRHLSVALLELPIRVQRSAVALTARPRTDPAAM